MLTGSMGLGDSFPCHLHGNLHAICSGKYAVLPPTIVQCKCNARKVNCIEREKCSPIKRKCSVSFFSGILA